MLKRIDLPPVWLIAALVLAWWLASLTPGRVPGARLIGTTVLLAGIAVMALAVVEFLRARTTIVPRKEPSALVTGGIYRFTRNPIYLGDALILAGLVLRWEAWLALPLIPAFVWVIDRRFVRQEEATLAAAFPEAFAAYATRTRRWI